MKSVTFASSAQTLVHLNLSRMDFLDDPDAILWCRLIISRSTQDAGPNEFSNPEILMINRPWSPHSLAMILPAIFPEHDISSCACIVLLFETSSSSHVQYHIARQRRRLGPEPAIGPCITASDHEILHFSVKLIWPCARPVFSIWIFWMTLLQSNEAGW